MPPMPLNPILEAPIHSLPSPLVQLEEGRGGFCKCAGFLKGYVCVSACMSVFFYVQTTNIFSLITSSCL